MVYASAEDMMKNEQIQKKSTSCLIAVIVLIGCAVFAPFLFVVALFLIPASGTIHLNTNGAVIAQTVQANAVQASSIDSLMPILIFGIVVLPVIVVVLALVFLRQSWKKSTDVQLQDISSIGFKNSPSQPPGTIPMYRGALPSIFSRTTEMRQTKRDLSASPFIQLIVNIFFCIVVLGAFQQMPWMDVYFGVGILAIGTVIVLLILYLKRNKQIYALFGSSDGAIYAQIIRLSSTYEIYGKFVALPMQMVILTWILNAVMHAQTDAIVISAFVAVVWIGAGIVEYATIIGALEHVTDYAEVEKQMTLINNKKAVITMVVIACALFLNQYVGWRLPEMIFWIFLFVTVLMGMLTLIVSHREKQNVVQMPTLPTEPSEAKKLNARPEVSLAAIFGIRNNVIGGTMVMGKGKVDYPENTLLVTDQRVCVLFIPVPGMDALTGDRKYPMENFYYNRPIIEQNARTLFDMRTIDEILAMSEKSWAIPFSEMKTCTIDLKYRYVQIEDFKENVWKYWYLDAPVGPSVRDALVKGLGSRCVVKE